jgi:hypothetical protein
LSDPVGKGLDWIDKEMRQKKLMNKEDFDGIHVVSSCTAAMKIIKDVHERSKNDGFVCRNFSKYGKGAKVK